MTIDGTNGPTIGSSLGGTRRLTVTLQALPDPVKDLAAASDAEKEKLRAIAVSNLASLTNGSLTAREDGNKTYSTQLPILSVNGTAIPFPYDIVPVKVKEKGVDVMRLQLSADVPDSLLTDTSAATIRIAWPFYDPAKWSSSISYSPPNAQFKAARVSDNTFVLSRINGNAFVGINNASKHCWTLIATDKPIPFGTPDCSPAPAPQNSPKAPKKAGKKQPATKQPEPPQPTVKSIPSDDKPVYSFLFTLPAKAPSKAILVSTDGGIYTLDIPDTSDKKDTAAAKVTTLEQFDAAWIDIAYPADKVPDRVETNGRALTWRLDPPDPKAKPAATATAKAADKTVHVEITRTETAKPGLLDVVVFDKTNAQIAKQQVRITCTLCGDGGNK